MVENQEQFHDIKTPSATSPQSQPLKPKLQVKSHHRVKTIITQSPQFHRPCCQLLQVGFQLQEGDRKAVGYHLLHPLL